MFLWVSDPDMEPDAEMLGLCSISLVFAFSVCSALRKAFKCGIKRKTMLAVQFRFSKASPFDWLLEVSKSSSQRSLEHTCSQTDLGYCFPRRATPRGCGVKSGFVLCD